MKIVIMAGGKGTRISSINNEVPKPMINICNKPILEHQICCLKNQGYIDIIIAVGHLKEKIIEYFGDGKNFGVNITYIIEDQPLGTAGALFLLKDTVKEDFLLINGDLIFDIDIDKFYKYHKLHNKTVTLFTHPNDHPYDSAIIVADKNMSVIKWLHKEDERTWYKNRVNAGLHIISPKIFKSFTQLKKTDLDRDILRPMAKTGELIVYDSPEYVKDMGTPDRFYAVEEDIKSGKIKAKNLKNKQKAVFFDRDGTLNKYVGFLKNIDQFELLPNAAQMVKQANQNGYIAIVVTNQPVIARGDVTWDELDKIHDKMETLLGHQGAYLDDIFVCPHHPDKGFEGEVIEYKIDCNCRKPKPGMLLEAAKKYNIDLSESYMVGDSESDMKAGESAGCRCKYVGKP